jgi:DNA-binding transcriptional LysR family regulator
MQDLNDLYYYVHVVDDGGFAAAGRALGVPKSKLSRRIGLLEERLGVRLLQRSTRRFAVTDIGQTYYAHCKAMLVEAEAAQQAIDLSRAEPRGIVRLACPIALLEAQMGPMIAGFMAEHPRVDVHLDASNRRVDVVGEGFDIALRVRSPPLEDSDLALRVLGESAQCLAAAPALLARLGAPQVPAELGRLPSLGLGAPQQEYAWQLHGPGGVSAVIPHRPRLISSDLGMLRTAALAGVGVAQMPTMMVVDELTRGALVRLLPGWAPPPGIVHAVFPSRRGLLPSVRALIDFLAARFTDLGADAGVAAS